MKTRQYLSCVGSCGNLRLQERHALTGGSGAGGGGCLDRDYISYCVYINE